MKNRKAPAKRPEAIAPEPRPAGWQWLHPALLAVAAFLLAFEIYSPALSGPFLLDDLYLPFHDPNASTLYSVWFGGQRPMLMVSYYFNWMQSGIASTTGYHSINVLLHWLSALLVFAIVRRLAGPTAGVVSAIAAGLFLVHPVQTEAVAYIAGRSDGLSAFFCFAAILVFVLGREAGVGWGRAAAILALFAAAVLTKENAAILPAALIAMDFALEGTAALKRNARLHAPVAAAGALGAGYVLWRLSYSTTAGFNAGTPWQHYFYTQCRVFWRYVKLIVLPVDLNVDPDFAISKSLADPAAAAGLAGIVALAAAAWIFRRSMPLASVGFLIFLILLAPTSSFFPIKDLVAERRLYLPFLGISLIAAGLMRRAPWGVFPLSCAGGVVLLALSVWTHDRAKVWSGETELWEDTVKKSPRKWRPRFQLADAYYQQQRFADANREFAAAATLDKPDVRLLVNWALSLDSGGDPAGALDKLSQAAAIEKSAHVLALTGMVHGKQGRAEQALAALAEAERIDPGHAPLFTYRGNVYGGQGKWTEAAAEFRKALAIDRNEAGARRGLTVAARNGAR